MSLEIVRCDMCHSDGVLAAAETTREAEGGVSIDLCGPCLWQWDGALKRLGLTSRDPFPLPNHSTSLLEDVASRVHRLH